MTALELIKELQKEVEKNGDRQVYLYISLGEDAQGVSRGAVSKEINIITAWVNKDETEPSFDTVIHLHGEKY